MKHSAAFYKSDVVTGTKRDPGFDGKGFAES